MKGSYFKFNWGTTTMYWNLFFLDICGYSLVGILALKYNMFKTMP